MWATTQAHVLHTKRPTRTTTLFTVSTRPPLQNFPQRLLSYIIVLARIVICGSILLVFLSLSHLVHPSSALIHESGIGSWLLGSTAGHAAGWVAVRANSKWIVLGGVLGLWAVFRRGYTGMNSV
ncbi:hypothetical protein M501DRAFT_348826 [Patellaria atrata CBS 101060]|uniref:Uncharacterized protein n=1 Tax=Patellaria atrata CBS 101060 TaxID=1346257 RepID=A0A9P4VQD4_9PEZI|nr:hypothetical protein M501DRAFT_348826 [Patellaria atrata CBS 101060]